LSAQPSEAHAEQVDLLGVRFCALREVDVVRHVFGALGNGDGPGAPRGGWILTPNVDILRKIVRHPGTRKIVSAADVVVADGMPLIWASRLQKTPLPERVTGAALLPALCDRAESAGRKVYLLGGGRGVADAGVARLRKRHPGLAVDGWSPPFGLESSPAGMAEIGTRVAEAKPDLVFCGFGFPKQEMIIAELRSAMPDVWFIGCGAALNFAAGEVSRAPQWMQQYGLEWMHRLLKEPRRMFRRYIIDDIPFALMLLYRSARRRTMMT
jgi:N-acetylglucosaminyldiphosphoundecaprenol N-acetyl-beta-D-mannosaminyltransferase